MATYKATSLKDIINGPKVAAPGDWIDALEGDDEVVLGQQQTFVSGPGNDKVTGTNGHGGYGLWFATEKPFVDLSKGYALDGFGGRDELSGIDVVHLTALGGTVIGTANAEQVFIFGGNNTIDLGGGNDEVRYHEKQSADYTLKAAGGAIEVRGKDGSVDTLKGVEQIVFADRTVSAAFLTAPVRAEYQYLAYEFRETHMAPSYVYAGVTYPPALLSWFPQAVFQLDLDGDGRKDVIAPMNKGYASGQDARTPFVALTTASGKLVFDAAINARMPDTPGARRAAAIDLAAEGRQGIVTVSHDAHDGKLADLYLLRPDAVRPDASAYVPTLPLALSGRPHAVDAHSMATGDLNGDGRTDILVGDWNTEGAYALLQKADGSFTLDRQAAYKAITWNWPLVNPNAGEKANVLVDLAIADVDRNGYGDVIAGWGHGSTSSYVFLNNGGAVSVDNKMALPDSIYGIDNQMHMKTLVADFDRDGDMDLAVLRVRFEPYYAGQYLQMLRNDGAGKFTDVTTANVDKPFLDAYGARLEWSDYWQLLDVNGDGAMDIVGQRAVGSKAPLVYVNDGAGRFSVVEIVADAPEGSPISWGDFDGDGKLEYVTFDTPWADASGTAANIRFAVFEMSEALGTGPNMAKAGAYNEGYYLNQNADVKALVAGGQYATGLEHYLARGKAEGRQAIAPGTTVNGGDGADTLTLREGDETAFGGAGADRLQGLDGNDSLWGNAGDDTLEGGNGRDRAMFAGKRDDFTIVQSGGGFTVTDKTGKEGSDTLSGVERAVFADGAVALDVDGVAGQAFRVYQAAFARTPDLGGLGYWIAEMDRGASLKSVAQEFVNSPEFRSLYGSNPSNRDVVAKFYENVLHRPGEQAGIDYWAGVLDSHADTVAGVLMGFSESTENQAALVGVMKNGVAYTPYG